MKSLLIASLGLVLSAATFAGPNKDNAAKVLRLLKATHSSAIECITQDKDKDAIVIKAGKNPEDNTGLVVKNDSGTYSYGTDQINDISATRSGLMINWGEEGNYHLFIPNWDWLLFSSEESGTSKLEANHELTTLGVVFAETETMAQLKCRVK